MARKFEKISLKQFKKDTNQNQETYEKYKLPARSTKYSAGYDFKLLTNITLSPKEEITIPTGIKVSMEKDEVLLLFIRSSLGFKYNLRMCNQVGVIDSDYFNNQDNEGHILIKIKNEGDKKVNLKKGDNFVQGIFIKYLTVDDEQEIITSRKGGIGSTNKEEK
jgi:dUTP pyrophosphatase